MTDMTDMASTAAAARCVTCYAVHNGWAPDMGDEIPFHPGTCATCGRSAIVFGVESESDRQEHAERFTAAYYRADVPAPPCHVCSGHRTVYCNGDAFGYCLEHYPRGLL